MMAKNSATDLRQNMLKMPVSKHHNSEILPNFRYGGVNWVVLVDTQPCLPMLFHSRMALNMPALAIRTDAFRLP